MNRKPLQEVAVLADYAIISDVNVCSLRTTLVSTVQAIDKSIVTLLKSLLRPALRFCLRNSIQVRTVFEAAKTVLVELAVDEIKRTQSEVTISRISVMTGLNRRDAGRIYREEGSAYRVDNLSSRVLGLWEQDSRFLTKSRKPRVLRYQGKDSEFKTLVKLVSKELNPATVLFELERTGAVSRTSKGVKLIRAVELYEGKPAKGLDLLARDIDTLATLVEENLFQPSAIRNLHIRTEYDNIIVKELPKIRKWLLKQGKLFHKRTRTYVSQYDIDLNPDITEEAGARVVLGAFSWTKEETEG